MKTTRPCPTPGLASRKPRRPVQSASPDPEDRMNHRLVHHVVLLAAAALLTLPGLGAVSLWDMDEGLNAEAAREMLESGNWVVPRFNFQLRDAKPALLYWLQLGAYRAFGVNEFAARLPSAVAAALAALL